MWLLFFVFHSHVSASSVPRWQISLSSSGRIDLSFENQRVLYDSCPSLVVPPGKARISFCDKKHYASAILQAPSTGHDDLGKYSEQIISYKPVSATSPAADCVLRMYDATARTVQLQIKFASLFVTNLISPLSEAKWSIGKAWTPRILDVPLDNDIQSMYASVPAGPLTFGTSCFVTTVYEETSRHGLVVGFLEHDVWKSGIEYHGYHLNAVAGINGKILTRDSASHGMVSTSSSPVLSIGFYDDWRDGMEEFAWMQRGVAGGKPVPLPLGLESRPIAGWNSWAMAAAQLGQPNLTNLFAASDVLAPLISKGFGPTQFITRDAVYGLNDTQTATWVDHVKTHVGQRTGAYAAPFAWWSPYPGDQSTIDCHGNACNISAPDCWTVYDILLKDAQGNPIRALESKIEKSNFHIRDPTHPNTECSFRRTIEDYLKQGYTLIKVDFLNMGALEGERYNKTLAPTGMAAYSYFLELMSRIVANRAVLDYGISLPLPVGSAGHARHQGCEQMYGGVEYGMNQFAGGWWLNTLYTWLDPDLVAFQGDYWFRPFLKNYTKLLSMDARSRVAKAVVYGGLFKSGDDLSNKTNAALAQKYLGNSRVNSMWSMARAGVQGTGFRPASWGKGVIIAPSTFTRPNGDIAIFNYSPLARNFEVDTYEAGFPANTTMSCLDAWEGTAAGTIQNGVLKLRVPGRSSALLQCRTEMLEIIV